MANTTDKTPRITKAQRFADIKALLNGMAVKYGTTVDDANSVLDHELKLLAKKNNSDTKKQAEAQKANEGYMALILDYLRTLPADSDGVTCTEIGKAIPALNDFNNQKISSLMRPLKQSSQVVCKTVKGKSLFSLA